MTTFITLDGAGRFVLPKTFRERLHLTAGSKLRAEIVADKIELVPEPAEDVRLVKKGRRLVLPGTGKPLDAAAAVRAEREAQAGRGRRR